MVWVPVIVPAEVIEFWNNSIDAEVVHPFGVSMSTLNTKGFGNTPVGEYVAEF